MTQIGRPRRLLAAALLIGFGACDHTKPQVPTTFTKLTDNQQSTVGTATKNPPTVSILDADGKGIAGISVTFALAGGGGSLAGATNGTMTVTTNSAGLATAGMWTLGTTAGPNTVTAAAVNVPGSPLTLTAIALAGAPTQVTKVSIDPTSAPAGGNVDSIVVAVMDRFSNPVGGASVTFAVTAGSGSVSSSTVLTGANGQAAARWTLGTVAGETNTATATIAGVATQVTFSTVTRIPVTTVRFAASTFVVDSSGTITPGVSAFDPQGSAITGATITIVARSANAVAISGATVTGSHPGESIIVATSADNPAVKDSALVVVANTTAPVIVSSIPRFDLKTDTVFTVPIVIDMRASGLKVGAATLQITWDSTLFVFQGSAAGSAAISGLVSNEAAASSGSITMTFADPNGFGNQVEVRKLTFKAASVAGKFGLFTLNAIDLVSTTPTNLQPKTVASVYPFKTR
jgi:hypothetical protein